MAYITAAELDNALPADVRNRATVAQKGQVIASASSEVDGYLRSAGYVLPLISWDEALKEHAAAIAAYRLAVATGLLKAESLKDSTLYANSQAALTYLQRIVDGTLTPGIKDSGVASEPLSGPQMVTNPRRGW